MGLPYLYWKCSKLFSNYIANCKKFIKNYCSFKDFGFLGCDNMQSSVNLVIFQRSLLPEFLGYMFTFFHFRHGGGSFLCYSG
jgi:hypothetical protein